jgi:MFS family permease
VSPFAPFRHRPFAQVWMGAFVSNIGNWMEAIAVGTYVADTTGKASWTGVAAAAAFLPTAVLGPLGGALADRVNRQFLMVVTTLCQLGFALALTVLVATGRPGPGMISLLAFGNGASGALGFPAYQAIMPDLLPQRLLLPAISLSQAQFNLGRVIGPALAGIVISTLGYEWAFGFNAFSFLAVVLAVSLLRLPPVRGTAGTPIRETIAEGYRYVRADPAIRSSMGALALYAVFISPFIGLVPAVIEKVFDGGPRQTSILVTAQGIGAVSMALVIGWLSRRYGRRGLLVGVMTALPPAIVLYALAPTVWTAAVAIGVVGFLYLAMLSGLGAVAQTRTPRHLRGRVVSLFFATLGLSYPVGLTIQGWLGDRIGLRATAAGAAVIGGIVALAIHLARPQLTSLWGEELDEPVPDVSGGVSRS